MYITSTAVLSLFFFFIKERWKNIYWSSLIWIENWNNKELCSYSVLSEYAWNEKFHHFTEWWSAFSWWTHYNKISAQIRSLIKSYQKILLWKRYICVQETMADSRPRLREYVLSCSSSTKHGHSIQENTIIFRTNFNVLNSR